MQQANSAPSIYSSLDPAVKQIRLLTVEPSLTGHGLVSGRLDITSLAKNPTLGYEAVSWFWGDTGCKREMLVNGALLQFPANAVEALEKLCVTQQHYRIWIDAVCICQTDLDERSQQISLMEDIYSRATQTLVWLGEGISDALPSLDMLKKQFLEYTQLPDGTYNNDQIRSRIFFTTGTPSPAFTTMPLPDCDWQAIERFFSAPWVSRLWVCQEVMLNSRAICVCGSVERSWYDVGLAAKWLNYCRYWRPEYLGKRVPSIGSAGAIWVYTYCNPPDWENLLWISRDRQATLPVDHVFGLLGMVPKLSASQIAKSERDLQPDYRKDLSTVFAAATRVAIKARGTFTNALNVLWMAQALVPAVSRATQTHRERVDDANWPSWVPRYDWVVDFERGSPVTMSDWHGDNAAGTYRATQMADYTTAPLVLGLQGLVVSTVALTGQVLNRQTITDEETLAREVLLWRQRARDVRMTDSDFAMTLTSRKNHLEGDAANDAEFGYHYAAFIWECRAESSSRRWSTDSQAYIEALWRGSANKMCFMLENGQIGLGNPRTRPGDLICILFSGMSPFILRQIQGQYRLIGDAYIHDIMHGEYIERWKKQPSHESQIQQFDIV